ncbi:MAG: PIN domain-containing protein [Deltaproteobacteria bacterium]|nr:PIN domain-containing protein [Deltaproteobacteria bacterium]
MQAALDTSFILSIIIRRETTDSALRILSKITKDYDEIFVPQQVIAEVAYVLEGIHKYTRQRKKLSANEISDYIESIMNTPKFIIENERGISSALKYYRELNIGFGDSLIAGTVRSRGIDKIASMDKDFERIGDLEVIKF